MAMVMASRGVSLCVVVQPPRSVSSLLRRIPTTSTMLVFRAENSLLQQWSFRSLFMSGGFELMGRRRRTSSCWKHGFCWVRRIPSDENVAAAALADFGLLGELGLNVEFEKKERSALDSAAEMSRVQPTGVRGSRRAPGLRFRVKESKLEKRGFRPAGLVGDSYLKGRVGNADDLQASVHDLQIHAGNADTFPDVDATGTCHSLHQAGGMSAGSNTEVREESRNDPQSWSTSGDSEDLLNQKQQQWFPYEDSFKLNDETTLTSADVIRMLAPFLVDGRKQRIEEVVANRTYSVCPVVEGLLDLGNVSAVFRSADALGFQSVHVISNVSNRRYKKNRKVSAGAEKWLDVEMWENTGACIATLKARGYRIAVTHIAPDTVSIHDMDWRVPTAVFFGNEHKGVSAEAIALSDIRCSIPMAGMVDSFNVSVAAGILMHHAVHDRIARAGAHGDLTPRDRQVLEAEFSLRHNRHTVQILDRLVEQKEGAQKPSSLSDMLKGDFVSDIEDAEYLQV